MGCQHKNVKWDFRTTLWTNPAMYPGECQDCGANLTVECGKVIRQSRRDEIREIVREELAAQQNSG